MDSLSPNSESMEEENFFSNGLKSGENDLLSLSKPSKEDSLGTENGNNRGAVDLFPARNAESRLHQFAGTPRPGLVDSPFAALSAERSDLWSADQRSAARGSPLEGRKKSRERLNLELKDVKTGETGETGESGSSETIKSSIFGDSETEKADVELSVDLYLKGREGNGDTGNSGGLKGSGLEDALARELRENLNTDIVKQASILVRNQQEGTIRLTLRPESLGNVKIRLEMAENKITGHIIVESSEAFKAFERELPVLEKAFRDSGFSETNLDMSMAHDGGAYNADRGQNDGEFKSLSPVLAASRYEAGMVEREIIPEGFFPENSGQKAVNMLV
jgi:hypothetical protein